MNALLLLSTSPSTASANTESVLALGLELLTVVTVIGVLALLAVRRLGGGARRGSKRERALIDTLETRVLGPKRSVHLLRVGASYVLVGASEAGLQRLAGNNLDSSALDELTRHELPVAPPRSSLPFLERLFRGAPQP